MEKSNNSVKKIVISFELEIDLEDPNAKEGTKVKLKDLYHEVKRILKLGYGEGYLYEGRSTSNIYKGVSAYKRIIPVNTWKKG